MAVCLAGITIFSGCDETENVPDIKSENEAALTQTAFADETGVKSDVTFVTAGAWTSSIAEGVASKSAGMATGSVKAGAGSWITITPDHGDAAGKYTGIAPHSFQPSSVNTFFANERFNLGNTENTLFFYTPQGSIGSSITVSLTAYVTPDGASQIVSWNSSNGFVAYYPKIPVFCNHISIKLL
jgi:hypothetical protein